MALTDPAALAARRTFAPEDVFFSTTDRKGVIRHANDTFLRLAALTEEEAVGSPHNLIRHPDMPGGAFRLVWDELEAGRPVCFYIANEAKDGVRYDVLATILPIDGGYLSVRLRPSLAELQDQVFAAYDDVAEREAAVRRAGASRHSAAERGASLLGGALHALGFASMVSFTRSVLPREVDALVAALPPAVAPGPRAGALGSVLQAGQEIGRSMTSFIGLLEGFEETAQRIVLEHDSLTPAMGELMALRIELARIAGIISTAAHEHADDAELPELVSLTREMDASCEDALDGLESLPLDRLQVAIRDLVLRIATVGLLNQMVTRFTSEVIEAGPDGTPRGTELRLLHTALEEEVDRAELGTTRVVDLLRIVPELTELAVRSVDLTLIRADGWSKRLLAAVEEGRFGDDGPELIGLVEAAKEGLTERVIGLGDIVGLASRLRQTPVRFDPVSLREPLQHIAAGIAALP